MTTGFWDRVADVTDEHVCHVQCVAGEQNIVAKFVLNGTQRRLDRNQNETLAGTLARLRKTLAGAGKAKKSQLQPDQTVQTVEVHLSAADGSRISEETTNEEAWITGHKLQVNEMEFVCERNRPVIDLIHIKQNVIQGFAVQPLVNKSFADSVYFRWSVEQGDTWQVVSEQESFVPTSDCVGKRLKVEAVPVSTTETGELDIGRRVALELAEGVQAAPDLSVFKDRWRHVANTNKDGERDNFLRVMSYNLLADGTPAQRAGEYDYCESGAMEISYRKQLLTWELIQYDADVICLQEVTPHAYKTYMEPVMRQAGWTGVFCNKNFNAQMACAVFFKTSKYDLYMEENVDLHSEWQALKDARSHSISSLISDTLRLELDRANTVAQIVALTPKNDQESPFFVVNTHLMGSPTARLGRVIQVAAVMRRLRIAMTDCGLFDAPTVFSGDFNASPDEPVHQLLSTGRFSRKHKVWAETQSLFAEAENRNSNKKQTQEGVDVNTEIVFHRGASTAQRTYIDRRLDKGGAVVDFIYFSRNHFKLQNEHFPDFAPSDLFADTSIPSRRFGSDHVAIVQDLVWSNRSEAA
eukprot:CAMPEP_0177698978 /NCGR_PEP_ID=MMETSP0484_2-20121128/5338_1 /TAXON_ID=354590 /ORGANISM="Rhodomonas lens, Strain RHODO" /LENGTH=580 /DNA_ID=CAMNT_0019210125 /DNA_START=12 /DNA_END=1754 /DNA_ORIENTATION=+